MIGSRTCCYALCGAKNWKIVNNFYKTITNEENLMKLVVGLQGPRIRGYLQQLVGINGIWTNSNGKRSSVWLNQKLPFSKDNYLFQQKKYYSSDKKMPPIKVLNVAEKNDAAKNIAELLSRGRSQRVICF